MRAMYALCNEHVEVLAHILAVRHLADAVDAVSAEELVLGLDETLHFLERMEALMTAEEQVLMPSVVAIIKSDEAVASVRHQRAEIGCMAAELLALRLSIGERRDEVRQVNALRRLLYGVDAVTRLLIAQMEEIYLPLLGESLPTEVQQQLAVEVQRTASMLCHPSFASFSSRAAASRCYESAGAS